MIEDKKRKVYYFKSTNLTKGKIHIGTSGWSYKHWRGIFYPEKMKPADYLAYYSQSFSVTEINTSFYHLPRPETIEGWMEKVPRSFKFCPKMSRYITHMKKLHDPDQSLPPFFDLFDPMRRHAGPVLIQLPPFLKFKEDIARTFFSTLRKNYSEYRFALEIRNPSWLDDIALQLLKQCKIAIVISQSGVGFPYIESDDQKHIYIRFHGPGALYASSYPHEVLDSFASKMQAWANSGHDVWAFFNNDVSGYALTDASYLKKVLDCEKD